MSLETVTRRYATALADVVLQSGEIETVKVELKSWEDLINSNVDLKTAFGNPSIAHAKKEGVLEGLLERAKPTRTTANFLRVLLQNSRLTELPEINERFDSVLEERSGTVHGIIASAHELSADERQELKANLEKVTGKNVRLDYTIDPNLIGGVVARIGSTVYDGSVRTQLEHLREELYTR
jgi:F-type H+-transporting ATPase subunit delta